MPLRSAAAALLLWLAVPGVPARAAAPAPLPPAAGRKVDFTRDIRPILASRCYQCHGPEKQKAELRLDTRAGGLKGGEAGPVIVPGQSARSLLVQLVVGMDPDKRMPAKGPLLTAEQIGLLRAWIDQGAVWPEVPGAVQVVAKVDHWAFKAPVRPALPAVRERGWPRNPIDRFVLARLEKEKLAPSPRADRVTLIRRLSLDLLGLPPTPREIDAFVADRRPDAYDRLVERLLASPHYGECWGRHWLDVARYADTNGYEKDLPRSIWPYRDWVIDALNRDLPYDQFTIEQLAGDLLPNATLEQRVATGFLRNSMVNEEGGIDPEQFRMQGIIDRMDALGKAFLGLTINCAQCHNHKYDPIAQREYYQLFAFLNDQDEPSLEVPSAAQLAQRAEIRRQVTALEDQLRHEDPDLPTRQAAWEQAVRGRRGDWQVLTPDTWFGGNGAKFEKQDDESLLSTGSNPPDSTYVVTVRTHLQHLSGFRLEALTDPNLPRFGPGRSKTGNFVLSEFKVEATPLDAPSRTNEVALRHATADFSQPDFPVTNAIDGDVKTGWAVDAGPGRLNQNRKAVFETKEDVGAASGTLLTFTLQQKFGQEHTLGRFRLSATTAARPLEADPVPSQVREMLSVPPGQRTPEQARAIFSVFRLTDPKCAKVNQAIDKLMDGWPSGPTTLVLLERKHPRVTAILKRGQWNQPGEVVTPGVPAILPPLPKGAPLNRLTLAHWLVDRENPLVARVIVNRVWQAYFGEGLVTTPEDFGMRADPPSHPELLDWLACELMDRGWSIKAIHRLIVHSATYQQDSRLTPALAARDPYNRLLARGPRFRVEAETVRDIALAASGLLSPKIGGPSVYPPIPDGVLSLGYGSPMPWPTSTGEDRYRRAMYTFWKRSVPYPSLLIFDAPNADVACARRVRSDTPLQALTTLNDTVFEEAAQALALRVWREGGPSSRDRVIYAFRLCVGRKPTRAELHEVLGLLNEYWDYFENRTAAAVEVAAPDRRQPPPDVNLHRVAAWTLVARVLLNLDETITNE